jgi:hypothetical protein
MYGCLSDLAKINIIPIFSNNVEIICARQCHLECIIRKVDVYTVVDKVCDSYISIHNHISLYKNFDDLVSNNDRSATQVNLLSALCLLLLF